MENGSNHPNNTDNQQNNVDEELSKLLDSSLQEFGKSAPTAATAIKRTNNSEINADELGASASFDKEASQKSAAEFQNMLRQLSDMQKVMMEQMKQETMASSSDESNTATPAAAAAESIPPNAAGAGGEDDVQLAQAFLENLNFFAENAQKIQNAGTEEEFEEAIRKLQSDGEYENEFLPFMQGLMSNLLSKETLYPSLKEMAGKYPTWLEENRHKTEPASLERYEAQLRLINEACMEFEEEKEDDPDDVKGQRFDRLIVIMQKMQACGQPPEDLVGAMPPGWTLDEQTGIPHVVDKEKAAEACSIM